uniref:Uncharacterized protein n=1 Tax=Panagrolaimus davidi TaxID=227884 RepID=A0A914PMV4_9BILA
MISPNPTVSLKDKVGSATKANNFQSSQNTGDDPAISNILKSSNNKFLMVNEDSDSLFNTELCQTATGPSGSDMNQKENNNNLLTLNSVPTDIPLTPTSSSSSTFPLKFFYQK